MTYPGADCGQFERELDHARQCPREELLLLALIEHPCEVAVQTAEVPATLVARVVLQYGSLTTENRLENNANEIAV